MAKPAADMKQSDPATEMGKVAYTPVPAHEGPLDELKALNNTLAESTLTDEKRLEAETRKLALMQATLTSLQSKKTPPKEKVSWPTVRLWAYRTLVLFGFAIPMAEAFDSTSGLLMSFIPGIPDPAIIGISIAFGIISSVLFYSLEGQNLRASLKVGSADTARKLLNVYSQQVDVTKKLNQELRDSTNESEARNEYNFTLVKEFNCGLERVRQANFNKEAKESTGYKILRKIITVTGAILSSGSALFLVKSVLLVTAGAAFLATPAGWCTLGAAAFLGLLYYMVLQRKATNKVFLSSTKTHNKLKTELDEYCEKTTDGDLKNNLLLNKALDNKNMPNSMATLLTRLNEKDQELKAHKKEIAILKQGKAKDEPVLPSHTPLRPTLFGPQHKAYAYDDLVMNGGLRHKKRA